VDLLVLVVAAYFIGSVPFAWLIGRCGYGIDRRRVGGRNVGGGHLRAAAGFLPGCSAIVLDVAKGFAATLLGLRIAGSDGAMLGGTAAIIGHVWPIWLRFDGGRGAAAALGVATGLFPWLMAVLLPIAIVLIALTRKTVLVLATVMPVIPFAAVALGEPVHEAVFIVALFVGVGLKDAWDRLHAQPAEEQARLR